MRVFSVKSGIGNFGRAFSSEEAKKALAVQKEALDFLGCKDVITIIPEASFPVSKENFTGQGYINSKETSAFLDFWKIYTASNNVKILPIGEYFMGGEKNFYCAYRSSTLTLGINTINLNNLASGEYGSILSSQMLNKVKNSAHYDSMQNLASFENVCGNKSMQNEALKEAFSNFKKSCSSKVIALKKEFSIFKNTHAEFVEKRALFETLADIYKTDRFDAWNYLDKNLFNTKLISDKVRNIRIKSLKDNYKDKIDFVYFKQFLAEKELAKGRELLNKKGFKLTGDCPIAYSADERWGFPDAFSGAKIGWGLDGLDYVQFKDNQSPAARLLNLKVKACANRYDQLRIDCGWMYVKPKLVSESKEISKKLASAYSYEGIEYGNEIWRFNAGDLIIKQIEQAFKSVKKDKFNSKDLMFEIEAGANDLIPWTSNHIIDPLKGRKIVMSTLYMNDDYSNINFFKKKNVPRGDFVLMAGNHDHLALQAFANVQDTKGMLLDNGNNIKRMRSVQSRILAQDLGLDEKLLKKSPNDFVNAKFAYNFLAENIKMFFMDIFGRREQFNLQNKNSAINFRYMISSDYEKSFHEALQNGRGLNIYDALAKAVKAKGGDKICPNLYKQLLNYSQILYQKGALSLCEANSLVKHNVAPMGHGKLFSIAVLVAGVAGYLFDNINNKNIPQNNI